MSPGDLLLACALDAAVGDPRWLPHPVRIMGDAVDSFERYARCRCARPASLRAAGIVLALGLPSIAAFAGWAVIVVSTALHQSAGWVVGLYLACSTLAWRDLINHIGAVSDSLYAGSVSRAREAVGLVVGRDTDLLSEPEVVRAAVETTAESVSDGVIAPLLFLAVGGPPLALAYKAVSTLDSMVGHREERYRHFGWASARLDDVANWIPARITACLIVIAGGIVRRSLTSAKRGAAVFWRDGHKHPSPNSGRPEAAMAGVLGVRLGGVNVYKGLPDERPCLGDDVEPLVVRHIDQARATVTLAYLFAIAGAVGCLWL